MKLDINSPTYNCCDVSSILGEEVRVGKTGNQCIVRSRTTKRASPSPCQQGRQNTFTFVIELWRTLSSLQKEAWADFAFNNPVLDKCGDVSFISAYQWFTKINGVLVNFDSDKMIANPPAAYIAPVEDIAVSFSHQTFCFYGRNLLVAEFSPPVGFGLQIFSVMGDQPSLSRLNLKGNFLLASVQDTELLYGDPPDPGIDPSTLKMFAIAIRTAWKAYRKSASLQCKIPPITG